MDKFQTESNTDEQIKCPMHYLPDVLRRYIEDLARACDVAIDIPLAVVLNVLSASTLGKVKIKRLKGQPTPINQYTLVVAGVGYGKTSIITEAVQPIVKKNRELITHREAVSDIEQALFKKGTNEKEVEALKAELEYHRRAIERRSKIIVRNITSEALACELKRNSGFVYSCTAEGRKILDIICGRYLNGGTDEALYLNCFSGEDESVDRKDGTGIELSSPLINILWAV